MRKELIPRIEACRAGEQAKRGSTPAMAIAGMSRDQQDAATITPAANPIMASIRRRGSVSTKRTGSVPTAVNKYVPTVAISA